MLTLMQEDATMSKRLYRSKSDRKIAGVCGGLAEYFNIDPTIIRVIAVVSIFFTGAGILAYIVLALVVPIEP
jgi:phage shock protein PspC (stress-responsive transcriptional regulator)